MRILIIALFVVLITPCLSSAQALKVSIDSTEAPDLQEWGQRAKTICEQWYPFICKELASDGFTPPSAVTFKFQKEMGPPAATSGNTISINAPYVRQHTDDLGMMVHELTHVVQSYGRTPAGMGWMTEGIADYIRWHRYEPGMDHSRINPKTATYHDSYRTTARFLAYLTDKYDKQLVTKLNAQMRAGECSPGSFKELLNRDVDDLWSEFIATLDNHRGTAKGLLKGDGDSTKIDPPRDPSDPKSIALSIAFGCYCPPETPQGVLEAIWDDGLVVFASNPQQPGKNLQCGRITPSQLRKTLDDICAAGYFEIGTYQPPAAPDESHVRITATRAGKDSKHNWNEHLNSSLVNVDADPAFQRFAKVWAATRTTAAFARPKEPIPLEQDPDALKRYSAAQAAHALP
jgi:hypothetical protein